MINTSFKEHIRQLAIAKVFELLAQGLSKRAIAREVGYSRQWVCDVVKQRESTLSTGGDLTRVDTKEYN